ncbi:MAG: UvrD-helicase domain-containing protein, partial [Acidimicrobiaceae bacterium]|nr:UvrD-helicase domain-containing protein [Acidimicrobiaceae bacterium]
MIQEDRTLVVAGAGTGKTHTMVAKAHDTVRIGIAQSKEIAFVTFTRAAAEEIRQRCIELSGIEIGTIHHLARQIIIQAEGKRPKLSPLADEKHKLDRLDMIERWLIEAVQDDPSLLVDIHSRRAATERCQSPTVTTPPFVAVPPGRVRVRSWGEAQIALTLHLAGVTYKYEEEFPVPRQFRARPGARYLPDFFLPDDPDCTEAEITGGIWFEHFAHDRNNRLPSKWSEEERQRYETDREWKEDLHRRLETRFVFTEYGDIERCRASGESFPALVLQRIDALVRSSVALPTPAQIQGLIDELKADDAGARHLRATHEVDEWIRTYRQQLPGAPMAHSAMKDRGLLQEANALSRLAVPVMQRYVAHLNETGTVDHEGTILQALQYLSDGNVSSPWHVLLVDEYQDVNPAQAAFVHALWESAERSVPSKRPRLTAVGDDWQAIFAFQGGDVELIRGFNDPASSTQRFHERVALKQTYRFGTPLARSTRHFATRDRNSIDREVIGLESRSPNREWPNSIVLASAELTEQGRRSFGGRGDNRTCAVVTALRQVAAQSRQRAEWPSVLILGRKNSDIGQIGPPAGGGMDREHIRRECEKQAIEVEFSTVHRAKGREADYVIFVDTGPPRAAESGRERALARA